jgi:hypothetical protein
MFRLVFAHAHIAFGGVGWISMQLIPKAKQPFLFKFASRQKQSHTLKSEVLISKQS